MARRPEGYPRNAWRSENPVGMVTAWTAWDTSGVRRQKVTLQFDSNGNPNDLWVWGPKNVKERIDLSANDATERLARYTRA